MPTLTPEMVQQMIVSAFFALGLSGKASLPNSPWYFDSIGQLVDNDCRVKFSKSGCLVQDQHSRKMITKGPKVGLLFSLYSSLSSCSFLPFISCNSATVNFQLLHKHLGHPNSNVLHDL